MNINPCFGLHTARTVVHHFLSVGAEFSSPLVEYITLVTVNASENGTFCKRTLENKLLPGKLTWGREIGLKNTRYNCPQQRTITNIDDFYEKSWFGEIDFWCCM